MTHNNIIATIFEMLLLEVQFNHSFAKFYNRCKSHEFQLVQKIITVASNNPMSTVGTNIKNVHEVDLLYNQWLLHMDMIINDVNIKRELTDVCENYKSINVLIMCDLNFII